MLRDAAWKPGGCAAVLAAVVCVLPALTSARGDCPFAVSRATLVHITRDSSSSGGGAGRPVGRALLQGFDAAAFRQVDFAAVRADVLSTLTDSQASWPADFGTYGPLMIRLAWHCAGTYRTSDGRGGCDGARQRFEPERSWADNTNLDKARALLVPIKLKHGPGLSWADLIVLAGTEAIRSMGGPVLGFCAGRVDDADGAASLKLGPSAKQQAVAPCAVNGECKAPLGATTIGLIYVNPEGHMGNANPSESAPDIRATFDGMGMNVSETVALIGGGHAFGKVHGACPTGPGPGPSEEPTSPWPGTCGDGPTLGKGNDTFTSGFEGSWTTRPTRWSNDYFTSLLDYEWEVHLGPGGHRQWRPAAAAAVANSSDGALPFTRKARGGPRPAIMMLTSDVALLTDPDMKQQVVEYAGDLRKLEHEFSHAWYKLVSRDMGPITRCLGDDVPPAQPFQYPLPAVPANLADFSQVQDAIRQVLPTNTSASSSSFSSALAPDLAAGQPYYGALFATLAWRCASTFRSTDYLGGCNGARIRLAPEKDWPQNVAMDEVLAVLEPVKARFGSSLSYADLIVLAGTTAVADAAGLETLPFCGGRVDAIDGSGSTFLTPRTIADSSLTASQYGAATNLSSAWLELEDSAEVMGLTLRELVALQANLRSPSQQQRLGYSGTWTTDTALITTLSNAYFKALLLGDWRAVQSASGVAEYVADENSGMGGTGGAGGTGGTAQMYMAPSDLVLTYKPELRAIVEEYASDDAAFKAAFAGAWTKMMNADRFDGPAGSVCPT